MVAVGSGRPPGRELHRRGLAEHRRHRLRAHDRARHRDGVPVLQPRSHRLRLQRLPDPRRLADRRQWRAHPGVHVGAVRHPCRAHLLHHRLRHRRRRLVLAIRDRDGAPHGGRRRRQDHRAQRRRRVLVERGRDQLRRRRRRRVAPLDGRGLLRRRRHVQPRRLPPGRGVTAVGRRVGDGDRGRPREVRRRGDVRRRRLPGWRRVPLRQGVRAVRAGWCRHERSTSSSPAPTSTCASGSRATSRSGSPERTGWFPSVRDAASEAIRTWCRRRSGGS